MNPRARFITGISFVMKLATLLEIVSFAFLCHPKSSYKYLLFRRSITVLAPSLRIAEFKTSLSMAPNSANFVAFFCKTVPSFSIDSCNLSCAAATVGSACRVRMIGLSEIPSNMELRCRNSKSRYYLKLAFKYLTEHLDQ